jgi:general secretion pathway protein A
MYASHFGLKHDPFSIAPDPRYLFMSERHREALAHLLYGVKGGGGFVLLTGEIGAGKTTVCRCFLEQVPKRCNVAYIFNPKLSVLELLQTVCEEFGIPMPAERVGQATVKEYVDRLNAFLLKTHAVGFNSVLIIDEAQNLAPDVLEQLRLLTNLETSERKLLQIILIGQPELRDMLERPELEQLAQRVIARFHLDALSDKETEQYIRHRLAVAGLRGPNPFTRHAVRRIHELTGGVPRRINLLCGRAMLGAYGADRPRVEAEMVEQAAQEVFGARTLRAAASSSNWTQRSGHRVAIGVAGAVLLLGALAFAWDAATRHGAASAVAAAATKPIAHPVAKPAASAQPAAATLAPALVLDALPDPLLADERQAWRELARAWGVAIDAADPCTGAPGLQCFRRSNASLALLRQLARPGILTLRDANGHARYALLVGLTPTSATLQVGGVARRVSLAALAAAWRGEFATYWRVAPGAPKAAEGAPALQWIADQLARVPAAAGGGGGEPHARIAAFQVAQGLEADGRPGPMTLMQLNRALGVDEPRLQGS